MFTYTWNRFKCLLLLLYKPLVRALSLSCAPPAAREVYIELEILHQPAGKVRPLFTA